MRQGRQTIGDATIPTTSTDFLLDASSLLLATIFPIASRISRRMITRLTVTVRLLLPSVARVTGPRSSHILDQKAWSVHRGQGEDAIELISQTYRSFVI